MTAPAVSEITVVVACFNHKPYVEQALTAVFGQTEPPLNVIVTDDASSDGSAAFIDELVERNGWNVHRVFHTENRGVCATFNEALAAVETTFVAFISADDWMHPERLARQRAAFAEHGDDVALVHTDATMVNEAGTELGSRWSDQRPVAEEVLAGGSPDASSIFLWNYIAAPTVLLRASAVRDVGGYDENLTFEDLDMWVRLALDHRFVYLDEMLTYYRRVANSLGGKVNNSPGFARAKLRILSKLFGRTPELDAWTRETRYVVAKSAAQANLLGVSEAARCMWPYARSARRPGPLLFLAKNALRSLAHPRAIASERREATDATVK